MPERSLMDELDEAAIAAGHDCYCGSSPDVCEGRGGCPASREIDRLQARLDDIRKLAESLGDRSGEPLDPSLPPGDAGRYSDRRLVEPLRRMLLEILDRP